MASTAQDWYPDALAARIPWHANFAAQAVASGVARGLTAAQVTQIGLDATAVAQLVNYGEAVGAFSESVTAFRDAGAPGVREYRAHGIEDNLRSARTRRSSAR